MDEQNMNATIVIHARVETTGAAGRFLGTVATGGLMGSPVGSVS
jgi:hypothetical protein